jgi:hypothetical protein
MFATGNNTLGGSASAPGSDGWQGTRAQLRKLIRYGRLVALMVLLGAVFEAASLLGISITAPVGNTRMFLGGANLFLGAALVGSLVVYLVSKPRAAERNLMLLLGMMLELVLLSLRLAAGRRGWDLGANVGAGLGLAAIGTLGWRAWRQRPALRADTLLPLLAACAVPGFVILTEPFLEATAHLHPLTLDGRVYAAEATLGVQGSWVLGRLLNAWPALKLFIELIYVALPLALGWILALQVRDKTVRLRTDLLSVFIAAGVFGFLLYHFYPVAGPIYAFEASWPVQEPAVASQLLEPMQVKWIARNCMPSLHTTWALLIFLHARPFGLAVRVAAALFLLFTLIATMGLGYHYALDLVVAVPYTIALQGLFSPRHTGNARWRSVAGGALMVAVWIAMLRSGVELLQDTPMLTWAMVVATVAACAKLELDRVRASSEPRAEPDVAVGLAKAERA